MRRSVPNANRLAAASNALRRRIDFPYRVAALIGFGWCIVSACGEATKPAQPRGVSTGLTSDAGSEPASIDSFAPDAQAITDASMSDAGSHALTLDAGSGELAPSSHGPMTLPTSAKHPKPMPPMDDLDDAGVAANGGGRGYVDPDADGGEDDHDYFSTVAVDNGGTGPDLGNGDLWVSCWSNDGALYSAAGDGTGFGPSVQDIVISRIDGAPTGPVGLAGTYLSGGDSVAGVWSGAQYSRKPTGMLCIDGDLYLAVQDLKITTFSDAPAATIVRSQDKGMTWSWDHENPMFSNYVFTTIMFLDVGEDSADALDDYVYAYGIDDNWCFDTTLIPQTQLYLARVPRGMIQDRDQWEFFTGYGSEGNPRWDSDIDARAPVLEDTRRTYAMPLNSNLQFQNMTVINQGGVVYNAPLHRFIYSSWTEYTFEFYEAPTPWGPWTHFYTKDFGLMPWNGTRSGGYATSISSKFISADGTTMWLQANAQSPSGADLYHFALRSMHVTPYTPSEPQNQPSDAQLATTDAGAVPFAHAFRTSSGSILNDGVTSGQSDDSYTGDTTTADFWGYTWPHVLRVNELRYTTGNNTTAGGWFQDLTVQVRRGRAWVAVEDLTITPNYPFDDSVPDNSTYSLHFKEVTTDGVRIYGAPGGRNHFTTISELVVLDEPTEQSN
jgi:hypothetical protein